MRGVTVLTSTVNQETGLCPSRGRNINVRVDCEDDVERQRARRLRFELRVYSTGYTGLGAAGGNSRVGHTGINGDK